MENQSKDVGENELEEIEGEVFDTSAKRSTNYMEIEDILSTRRNSRL
jgi:hypothetical protein